MNNRLIIQAIILLATLATHTQTQSITLSFFVEHQVEIDKDYIEMIVNVKTEDTSLMFSLANAAENVAFVRSEVQNYCLSNTKKKEECQQISESGKFSVQPLYRTIRGQPVFIAFAVSYEVTAKILHHEGDIGTLIDRISKRNGITILSMEWKDAEEDDYEMITIDKGLQEAKTRCKNVGGALAEILSVSEVPNFELQQKPADQQEQQQEQEQQTEIVKYKFEVKCLLSGKKQTKKADKK